MPFDLCSPQWDSEGGGEDHFYPVYDHNKSLLIMGTRINIYNFIIL